MATGGRDSFGANGNDGCGGGGEGFDEPPKSPFLRRLDSDGEPLPPDTEENVTQQTEGVFRNFMHTRYERETSRQEIPLGTPNLPELSNFTDNPLSRTSEIGRQLAQIGDDINERYRDKFGQMISILDINQDTAYEAFAGVARRLFNGGINWGRIVTLLCFGYRIAVEVLNKGFHSFFNKIIQYVTTFIAKERIAAWIAQQGGWVAALRYVPEAFSSRTVLIICGIAFVIFGIYMVSKRNS